MRADHSARLGAPLPGATEHPLPVAPGGAPVELAPAEAVLRAAFPLWLRGRSAEYADAFADALLAMTAAPIAAASSFDRAVASALATGRGLAGLYVAGERGQA